MAIFGTATGPRRAMGVARHLIGAAGAAVVLAGPMATVVSAQSAPVVVELFTSQGCSSCPPADAMMIDLAARPGVIALAFHVDYWDYIGWRDSFGTPENTARQSAYAHAAQTTTVYTPQFIVGGVDHVIGARGMELVDRIDAHSGQDTGVSVTAERQGDTIAVRAETREGAQIAGPMVVQLIRYAPLQTVEIERGENAGLTVDYANTVMDWSVVSEWDGAAALSLSVPVSGTLPSVILVQATGSGPILAAVVVE